MQVDVSVEPRAPASAFAADVRTLEELGADGIFVPETNHEPFLACTLVAEHTTTAILGTRIAVAFARSPTTVASAAHDLQLYSEGRFVLGLGTQIRAHIERRFSMPWSNPAARIREFVLAVRAVWAAWNDGAPLAFEGEFYQLSLMTPVFSPPPSPHGAPRVHLAAVGDLMCETVGEVADGIVLHSFNTPRYLKSRIIPAVERGCARAGRSLADVDFCATVLVVTGADDAAMARADVATRERIAFYGSTPDYRGVFDAHGWGHLQEQLHELSRAREWAQMSTLVTDEVLDTFAVVGPPDEIGRTREGAIRRARATGGVRHPVRPRPRNARPRPSPASPDERRRGARLSSRRSSPRRPGTRRR